MPIYDLHSDVLEAFYTPYARKNIIRDIFSVNRVLFRDMSIITIEEDIFVSDKYDLYMNQLFLSPNVVFSSENGERLEGEGIWSSLKHSLGRVREISIQNNSYIFVPYFVLETNPGKVRGAYLEDEMKLVVEVNDISIVRKKINNNNESVNYENYFSSGGELYEIIDDYIFINIKEVGVEEEPENYDVFIFEEDQQSGEYKEVFLGEEEVDENGMSKITYFDDFSFSLYIDEEIPDKIYCKHVETYNTRSSVVYRNEGVVNIENNFKICREESFPKIYINRKEGVLGGNCQ